MALTLSTLTFSGTHNAYGKPLFGPFDGMTLRTAFPGSLGEVELRDQIKGRSIQIPYRIGHTSEANLLTALDNLAKAAGQVNGTLTYESATFANVTFMGFVPAERYKPVAGMGTTAWIQQGVLHFRQLSTYAPAEE